MEITVCKPGKPRGYGETMTSFDELYTNTDWTENYTSSNSVKIAQSIQPINWNSSYA